MAVAQWAAFVSTVLEVMHGKGTQYISRAFFPDPRADSIGDEYEVPVEIGSPGYADRHGRFIGL